MRADTVLGALPRGEQALLGAGEGEDSGGTSVTVRMRRSEQVGRVGRRGRCDTCGRDRGYSGLWTARMRGEHPGARPRLTGLASSNTTPRAVEHDMRAAMDCITTLMSCSARWGGGERGRWP